MKPYSLFSGFTACVTIVQVSTRWDGHSPDTRGQSAWTLLWPLEVNSVCMHIYMKNVLKRKYSFCCVDNCKRYNWEAWWKCSLEYFMCRHMVHQKGQRAVWSIDPKAKETFTMFTHQFNIYRKIKFNASPRLNSFCNMQEHKQINQYIIWPLNWSAFWNKNAASGQDKKAVMWGKKVLNHYFSRKTTIVK